MTADGTPLVLLHGFSDTPRTWDLVRPHLERRHVVRTPVLAGHAGGPPLPGGDASPRALADVVEAELDAAGIGAAHLAGNSLGGHVALQLAARGRARSVTAFAPAGGWATDDGLLQATLRRQREARAGLDALVPHADAIAATPEGRRRVLSLVAEDASEVPAELVAAIVRATAATPDADALLDAAEHADWTLDAAAITCPVRIVWGTADRLLPWPAAAARLRTAWLPHADWVELEGVGHAPQLERPLEAAQLILGLTCPGR